MKFVSDWATRAGPVSAPRRTARSLLPVAADGQRLPALGREATMRRANGLSVSAVPPIADVLLHSSETTRWATALNRCAIGRGGGRPFLARGEQLREQR
jgi:hypothetical protein